ncbi:MAG: sterol desaturase family protein, partial [Chitinophagaceae bacterium]|nr:sterol desaturase family protein [Chitinophagaceae bacterium]
MVVVLIYILLKKLCKKDRSALCHKITGQFLYRKYHFTSTIIFLLLLFSCTMFAQQQLLTYKVMRNGTEAGWVKLNKSTEGNSTVINMSSEIKVRMILLIKIISREWAEFRDGKMVHSYVFRKMNETVKVSNHTRLCNSGYEIENASGKERLHISPITFNVLSMYFGEPANEESVYSDSQQQLASVEKLRTGV